MILKSGTMMTWAGRVRVAGASRNSVVESLYSHPGGKRSAMTKPRDRGGRDRRRGERLGGHSLPYCTRIERAAATAMQSPTDHGSAVMAGIRHRNGAGHPRIPRAAPR